MHNKYTRMFKAAMLWLDNNLVGSLKNARPYYLTREVIEDESIHRAVERLQGRTGLPWPRRLCPIFIEQESCLVVVIARAQWNPEDPLAVLPDGVDGCDSARLFYFNQDGSITDRVMMLMHFDTGWMASEMLYRDTVKNQTVPGYGWVETTYTNHLALSFLAALVNIMVPCHYKVEVTIPEFGHKGFRKRRGKIKVDYVIAYNRLCSLANDPNAVGAVKPHGRRGHLKWQWAEKGIDRFRDLPEDALGRQRIADKFGVREVFCPPYWVGPRRFTDDDGVAYEIQPDGNGSGWSKQEVRADQVTAVRDLSCVTN